MKLELANYELSKKAKEAGFDWETNYYYSTDKELDRFMYFEQERRNSNGWSSSGEFDCSVPELELLSKWLRDEHDINVFIVPVISLVDDVTKTIYKWWIPDGKSLSGINYDTYEEALSEGLNRAMELI